MVVGPGTTYEQRSCSAVKQLRAANRLPEKWLHLGPTSGIHTKLTVMRSRFVGHLDIRHLMTGGEVDPSRFMRAGES